MEKQFQELCKQHGLTCLSVMFYPDSVTVFPHWDDLVGNDRCCSHSGETFEIAFSKALIEVSAAKAA